MENHKRQALSLHGWTCNGFRGERERWKHRRGKIGWLPLKQAFTALYTGNSNFEKRQIK